MRKNTCKRFHFLMLLLLPFSGLLPIHAQSFKIGLDNMVSGWTSIGFSNPVGWQLGGRYIPTLSIADSLAKERIIDAELSVNAYGNLGFTGNAYNEGDAVLKPYRLWLRYATPRLELRAGLQKINFGSATILRPLMWFDRMDYRDPLQLTDGVYAFLGRYYFQRNANIWLWVLYGNDDLKGWEAVPTQERTPEFGGRFQLPVGKGEAAISYHHRRAAFSFMIDTLLPPFEGEYPEDRIGIDGKWDLGVGIWFEGVVKHNEISNTLIKPWENYFNVGADYTFSVGGGLNLTAEYFRYSRKEKLTGSGQQSNYVAMAATYPLGILNRLAAVVYYNHEDQAWYRMLSIERSYDYWSYYLMAFWNPEEVTLYGDDENQQLYAGKGLLLMAVVNF